MRPYLMTGPDDCGPAMEAALCDLPLDEILARWPGGWRGKDSGRLGGPNDTPWDHFALLEALGNRYQIATLEGILRGEYPPDRTAILLHEGSKVPPRTWWEWLVSWVRGTYAQHWVILRSVDPGRGISVWSGLPGEDAIWYFSRDAIVSAFCRGWPNCAFEVGRGSHRLTPWQRAVACLTGRFI